MVLGVLAFRGFRVQSMGFKRFGLGMQERGSEVELCLNSTWRPF